MNPKLLAAGASAILLIAVILWPSELKETEVKALVTSYFDQTKVQSWEDLSQSLSSPINFQSIDNISNQTVEVELEANQFIDYLKELKSNQNGFQHFYTIQSINLEQGRAIALVDSNESWTMQDQTIKAKVVRRFEIEKGWAGVEITSLEMETNYQ